MTRTGQGTPSGGAVVLSVVIPCFQAEDVLPRCLASLAPAARAGVEIVVVDDGSVDRTGELLANWSDYPLLALHQPNSGPCAARNRGLTAARGRFVAFVDCDDVVTPGWHEFFLGLGDADPPALLATCGMRVLDLAGGEQIRSPEDLGPAYSGLTALLLPGAYAVARELLDAAGGFATDIPYGEHHELGLRLAPVLSGACALRVDDPLVVKHHDRSPGRVEGYGRARLVAAELVLRRHAQQLRRDPRMRGDYHAVASHAARQVGDRRGAVRHALSAVRSEPARLKQWGRLARLVTLPRARR